MSFVVGESCARWDPFGQSTKADRARRPTILANLYANDMNISCQVAQSMASQKKGFALRCPPILQ